MTKNDQTASRQDEEEDEELPFFTERDVEVITKALTDLGFNADWLQQRRVHAIKWDFWKMVATLVFLVVISAGLFYLVERGRLDAIAFSTILAVLVGAALREALPSRQVAQ